ncbi:MAG: hypothetical protein JWO88_3259 [Frankiales bacterium]|nr:hypothetical protein [Frankiales bacterium]
MVLSVLLVGPPLVIIQGTPRAQDWPWLALVGICLAGVGAGVPFALQGWVRRFPRAAMRVERFESSRWFLPAWVVAAAVTVLFVGFEKGMSTLVPTGVVMALLAWHGRSARDAKDA